MPIPDCEAGPIYRGQVRSAYHISRLMRGCFIREMAFSCWLFNLIIYFKNDRLPNIMGGSFYLRPSIKISGFYLGFDVREKFSIIGFTNSGISDLWK